MISNKLLPFGTSIFGEMTRLAIEHGAINLSQGFPDFDGPADVIDSVVEAMRAGHNQYARSMGHPLLVSAIADQRRRLHGLEIDPMREVIVFSGATEGIYSTLMGLLNTGDRVILFEPFYDSYPATVAMAGAIPLYATLRFPNFEVDFDALRKLFQKKPRLLVLNTPNNPTGKVFTRPELDQIAALCIEHDVLVMTDEVYEHLTYDGAQHIPIATIPGMWERTISLSSAGKTFSFTGWKVGWATGPGPLVAAAQAAHQFVTYATSTPMQIGIAAALKTHATEFLADLRAKYAARRNRLLAVLKDAGFEAAVPRGAYFILAAFANLFEGDDVAFAKHLVLNYGVAAIPPSSFYAASPEEGRRLIRFAFCKREETLEAAAARLQKLGDVRRPSRR